LPLKSNYNGLKQFKSEDFGGIEAQGRSVEAKLLLTKKDPPIE
jgi:hypothetical protein